MSTANNRNRFKISKKLKNHDRIIKAVTTYRYKDILTLEEGNYFYWIRQYADGDLLKDYYYLTDLENAIEKYHLVRKNLTFRLGLKLQYNIVN